MVIASILIPLKSFYNLFILSSCSPIFLIASLISFNSFELIEGPDYTIGALISVPDDAN